jgi:DNA transformation protein
MTSDLSKQINIGKDTEKKLQQVGINFFDELKSLGSEQTFIRLQTLDKGACISLLYGLEGAIQGIKYNKLPLERKLELQQFIKMAKKNL